MVSINKIKISTSLHDWDVSPKEAVLLQNKLAGSVIQKNQLGLVTNIAGVDVSIRNENAQGAVVVLSYPDLEIVDFAVSTRRVVFPYIPGLLSFREGPVILDAMEKLSITPDLLIFDGQGLAHPRRLGIASHMGLFTNLPSIGCAKSRLCGRYEEPGFERGSHVPLMDNGETIGAILRTRRGINPVFVSVGHRIDLATSIEYVLACCHGYRLPETTRQAHRIAGNDFRFQIDDLRMRIISIKIDGAERLPSI